MVEVWVVWSSFFAHGMVDNIVYVVRTAILKPEGLA
jgi:hypothetical protein